VHSDLNPAQVGLSKSPCLLLRCDGHICIHFCKLDGRLRALPAHAHHAKAVFFNLNILPYLPSLNFTRFWGLLGPAHSIVDANSRHFAEVPPGGSRRRFLLKLKAYRVFRRVGQVASTRVVRLMDARCAAISVRIRRRRTPRRSWPIFNRFQYLQSFSVPYLIFDQSRLPARSGVLWSNIRSSNGGTTTPPGGSTRGRAG